MDNSAIVTRGLTRRFGAMTAVDGVDLEVAEGRIFGFLGPNGAGKTTTIRMLTGILRPSAGQGRVVGFDLSADAEEIKRRIGYVAQHFGLYDNLTVRENLAFYGRVYGVRDESRLDSLVARYGFSEHRDVCAKHLSGGFRQRLSLICALTHEPRLLFLDEPTAGVDPAVRKDLWDLFYQLADGGTTLFVTTHYMEEAERCDRLAFIHRGRLVADDTPAGIRRSLADYDVFAVRCRYDPEVVRGARAADGVRMVNQFGSTLRVVADRGRYDCAGLAGSLGVDESAVGADEATIEDVFVMLTRAEPGGAR